MKKLINLIFLSAIAVFSFVACNKTEVGSDVSLNKEVVLTFTSAKPDLVNDNQTKTVWDANSKTIKWSTTDKIRVALKVGDYWQNGSGNATSESGKGPKLYESNQAGSEASIVDFKVPTYFKVTSTGEYKFYGIYPSSVTSTDANYTYMPSITVTLPTEQTPAAGTFDASGDIMISESTDTFNSIPEDPIQLDWTRIVAHGDITLKNLPTFEAGEVIRSITLTAQEGADLTGEHYLMLTTGEFSGSKGVNYVTINAKDNNLAINGEGNIEFWFTSLPFTATSLKATITTNKYVYSKEYTHISKEFQVNTRNYLGISMSNCSKTDAPAEQLIADGYYVISTEYNNSSYMMVANATESAKYQNSAPLGTTIEDGKLCVDDNAIWHFTFDSDNGVYYIQSVSEESFLGGLVSGSDLKLVSATNKVGFSIVEEGNGYHIVGTNNRWIGYNYSTSPVRFAMYSNDANQPGVVTLTPAKFEETPILVIEDIVLGNSAAVTEATTIEPTTQKFISTITVNGVYNEAACSSSATWLTVTYSNGTLSYTAEANTGNVGRIAYVSVKGANGNGDETENVVFSVTQPKYVSYINKWALVTNVSELAIGDKIVIVNTGGTKALGTTQNTNNRSAVDVTLDANDNHIVNVNDNVQQLTLGKTNNHWTLYTGSGYLYAASNSNNHLKTQTTNDANGEWTIVIDDSYKATVTAQGANTHNLIQYNSGSDIFACYTSSSQTAVKIYKLHVDPNAPTLNVSPTTTASEPIVWEADNDDAKEFTITSTNGTWSITNNGVSGWANVSTSGNKITVTPKTAQASAANSGSIKITLTPTDNKYSTLTETIYLSQAKYIGDDDTKGDAWTSGIFTATNQLASPIDGVTISASPLPNSCETSNYARGLAWSNGNSPVITLSGYSGGIETVSLVMSTNGTATSVVVGAGETTLASQSVTSGTSSANTTYTFTFSELESGDVTINVTNTSGKSVWIKSIAIN